MDPGDNSSKLPMQVEFYFVGGGGGGVTFAPMSMRKAAALSSAYTGRNVSVRIESTARNTISIPCVIMNGNSLPSGAGVVSKMVMPRTGCGSKVISNLKVTTSQVQ